MVLGYKEVRSKLGFFGKVCRTLFWGWQILLVFWLLKYSMDVAPLIKANTSPTGEVGIGTGIGLTVAIGMIVFFWFAGSNILGLFVLFTRGNRVLVALGDDTQGHRTTAPIKEAPVEHWKAQKMRGSARLHRACAARGSMVSPPFMPRPSSISFTGCKRRRRDKEPIHSRRSRDGGMHSSFPTL